MPAFIPSTRRYPGIKPVLGSLLDVTHPSARGLQGAWLLNDDGIALGAWDSSLFANRLSGPSNVKMVKDQPGRCLQATTTSGYQAGNANCGSIKYPFTVVALVTWSSLTHAGYYFSHDSGATATGYRVGLTSGGHPALTINTTVTGFTNISPSLNTWYLVAFTADGTNANCYLAPWLSASIQNQQLAVSTAISGTLNSITLVGYSPSSTVSHAGNLAWLYWYNYALTSAQIQQLFAEPYQMFAVPRRFYAQASTVQSYPQPSQRWDALPDLAYSWYEQFRLQPSPITFLPLPPLLGPHSQRIDPLLDLWWEWEAYTEIPYAQWFVPPLPPSYQPSQRWDTLPDYWQEWEAYGTRQPVPVTFLPLPPLLGPHSQRIDPLPDLWQEWYPQWEMPDASWYIPPLPPSYQPSQRWDALPDYWQEWQAYTTHQPIPVTYLPLPSLLRTHDPRIESFPDPWQEWQPLARIPIITVFTPVRNQQQPVLEERLWQWQQLLPVPKPVAPPAPYIPHTAQSPWMEPATAVIEVPGVWWKQGRYPPLPPQTAVGPPISWVGTTLIVSAWTGTTVIGIIWTGTTTQPITW